MPYLKEVDIFIAIGTSGTVYPAADYITYFRGKNTVLINRDPTPFDSRAGLVFHDSIGEVFESVMRLL